MIKKQLLAGALASTVLAAMALPVAASGNDWQNDYRGHGARGHGHPDSRKFSRSIGYTTPVTHVRGVGTFSRSVWVIHGIEKMSRPQPAPIAKIIQVDDRYFHRSDPCSYESGVCVIRAAN